MAVAHEGLPYLIPAAYGLDGDNLVVHGAQKNRVWELVGAGLEACVVVSLLDGLVLGRSPKRHSMNYRSVVIYGKFEECLTEEAKLRATRAMVEHAVPGRIDTLREPTENELSATRFFTIGLTEASAKIRAGEPSGDASDDLSVWAGVIPLGIDVGEPLPADEAAAALTQPEHVSNWRVRT